MRLPYSILLLPLLALSACAQSGSPHYTVPFRKGDKVGLSDERGKIVVSPKYAGIIWYPPYYYATGEHNEVLSVYDVAGAPVPGRHSLPPTLRTGKGFVIDKEAATDRFEGPVGWTQNRTPDIPYRLVRKEGKLPYPSSAFRLEDSAGGVLLPSVSEIDRINYRLIVVKEINTAQHRTLYPGVYDLLLKRYVYRNADENNDISTSNGFPEVRDGSGVHHFLDGEGREIGRTDRMQQRPLFEHVQRVVLNVPDSIREGGGGYNRKYAIFRSHSDSAYAVYNDSFRIVSSGRYTAFIPQGNPEQWVSVRTAGGWGLLDYELRPLLPPSSDTIIGIEHNRYALLRANGRRYRIDLQTGDTLRIPYDRIASTSVNGYWMAIRYVPHQYNIFVQYDPRADALYWIDKSGRVSDSFTLHEREAFEYLPTAGSNILRYPGDDARGFANIETQLLCRKGPRRLPYIFRDVHEAYGKAVAIACVNNDGKEGLVSADDFSVIVPFGTVGSVHCLPARIPARRAGDPPLEGLLITVITDDGLRKAFGFYGANGVRYWRD